MSDRNGPDDGTENEGPHDDDTVSSENGVTLKNHERPVGQWVEGEAAGTAKVYDHSIAG